MDERRRGRGVDYFWGELAVAAAGALSRSSGVERERVPVAPLRVPETMTRRFW